MKDSDLLVLMDLDSLIYHPKNYWRIINPLIGRVGSNVDLLYVLNFYLKNFHREGFYLFEYFIPNVMDFPCITSNQIEQESFNVMPVDKLKEAILQHRIRGRKIYFITLVVDNIIKEIFKNRIFQKNNWEELFYSLSWKDYWITPSINSIKNFEFPQFAKLLFIKKLLKTINKNQEKIELPFMEKFKRIFYYTTDLSMIELIHQHFLEHITDYEYRQNTIISYLVTQVIE